MSWFTPKFNKMKALQILIYIRRNKFIMDLLDEDSIDEAIAELELLQQPKSCVGCEYETLYDSQVICANKLPCGRDYFVDRFKPKER